MDHIDSARVLAATIHYKSGRHLSSAIRSLERQSFPLAGILLIDNASPDDEAVTEARRSPGIVLIRNEVNTGFARAANQALEYGFSHGYDAVWIFNPDAVAREDALSKLVSQLQRHRGRALLSPKIVFPNGKTWFERGIVDWIRMRALHVSAGDEAVVSNNDFVTGCAIFISRELYRTIGGFDPGFFLYYEDADLGRRARRAGIPVLTVTDAIVEHSEMSRENPEKTYWLVFSGLLFFEKWMTGASRSYFSLYVTMRRLKNWLDLRWNPNNTVARKVERAYADFFERTPKDSSQYNHR